MGNARKRKKKRTVKFYTTFYGARARALVNNEKHIKTRNFAPYDILCRILIYEQLIRGIEGGGRFHEEILHKAPRRLILLSRSFYCGRYFAIVRPTVLLYIALSY